jgi:chorismate mutase
MVGEHVLDVQKKLRSYDQKLLSLLISRFELISYIADAKYTLSDDKDSIVVENELRKKELLDFFKEQSKKLSQEKNIFDPEELSSFVTYLAEEMLEFSWKYQKKYLEKNYGVKTINKTDH